MSPGLALNLRLLFWVFKEEKLSSLLQNTGLVDSKFSEYDCEAENYFKHEYDCEVKSSSLFLIFFYFTPK